MIVVKPPNITPPGMGGFIDQNVFENQIFYAISAKVFTVASKSKDFYIIFILVKKETLGQYVYSTHQKFIISNTKIQSFDMHYGLSDIRDLLQSYMSPDNTPKDKAGVREIVYFEENDQNLFSNYLKKEGIQLEWLLSKLVPNEEVW